MHLRVETVGTADLQVNGSTGLDLLSGAQLHILPDFRIHREKGSLSQIITHALQQLVR